MKTISYLLNSSELLGLLDKGIEQVIIEPKALSRLGKLSINEVNKLAEKASQMGLKVFLEWDILMVEDNFNSSLLEFKKINLKHITALRVQDPGALKWCLENTSLDIHLNLETGNHNLRGINSWLDTDRKRITRLILSIEWSQQQLKGLIPNLECEIEFLGMGRILLFYTPRYLLKAGLSESEAALEMNNSNHWIEASGQSEESPHKGFPLLENQHGTFMFLPSDHCLLDHLSELKELGIDHLRIDNRFMNSALTEEVCSFILNPVEDGIEKLKELSGQRLIRGFFNTNKSDVLFKKLKNHRIQRIDEDYLGQILEVNKKNYLALKLKNPVKMIKCGAKLKLITPDGKEKFLEVQRLQNCQGIDLECAGGEDLVFINHVGGVSVKAAVYYEKS
jgi:putative protease